MAIAIKVTTIIVVTAAAILFNSSQTVIIDIKIVIVRPWQHFFDRSAQKEDDFCGE